MRRIVLAALSLAALPLPALATEPPPEVLEFEVSDQPVVVSLDVAGRVDLDVTLQLRAWDTQLAHAAAWLVSAGRELHDEDLVTRVAAARSDALSVQSDLGARTPAPVQTVSGVSTVTTTYRALPAGPHELFAAAAALGGDVEATVRLTVSPSWGSSVTISAPEDAGGTVLVPDAGITRAAQVTAGAASASAGRVWEMQAEGRLLGSLAAGTPTAVIYRGPTETAIATAGWSFFGRSAGTHRVIVAAETGSTPLSVLVLDRSR